MLIKLTGIPSMQKHNQGKKRKPWPAFFVTLKTLNADGGYRDQLNDAPLPAAWEMLFSEKEFKVSKQNVDAQLEAINQELDLLTSDIDVFI